MKTAIEQMPEDERAAATVFSAVIESTESEVSRARLTAIDPQIARFLRFDESAIGDICGSNRLLASRVPLFEFVLELGGFFVAFFGDG